jgi:hypothetical protein
MKTVSHCVEWEEMPGASVADAEPELQDIFFLCVTYLRKKLGRKTRVTVTSVLRDDPKSVHAYGRGIDFVVEGMEDNEDIMNEILDLQCWINREFRYLKSNFEPSFTFWYRMRTSGVGSDPNHKRHVHLQKPTGGWV